MMAANLLSPPVVNHRLRAFTERERAALHDAVMRDRIAHVLRVFNLEDCTVSTQLSAIADLSATLGIERRAIENDDAAFAERERLDRRTVFDDRGDLAIALQPLIPGEDRRDRRNLRQRDG